MCTVMITLDRILSLGLGQSYASFRAGNYSLGSILVIDINGLRCLVWSLKYFRLRLVSCKGVIFLHYCSPYLLTQRPLSSAPLPHFLFCWWHQTLYAWFMPIDDCLKLQTDVDSFSLWFRKLCLSLNLSKC